jgi:hypothetical protein
MDYPAKGPEKPRVRHDSDLIMRRLKCAHYYDTIGREDHLTVELPKGSYVPRFSSPAEPAVAGPLRTDRGNQVYSPQKREACDVAA